MSAATGALIVGAVGLATSLTTTGISFSQASAERDKMNAANDAAAKAMMEARKKLEVNYMDELSINKEAYEMQQDTILAQAQAATQMGVEGSARGAGATVGRVQLATQAGAQQTRTQMAAELQKLEQLSAQEDSRIRDIGVQLDLQEVEGAQNAARDAEARAEAAQQQAMEGVQQSVQQGISLGVGLYGKDIGGQQEAMDRYTAGYEADRAAFADSGMDDAAVQAALDKKYGDFTFSGEIGRGGKKQSYTDAQLDSFSFEDMTRGQFKDWSKTTQAQNIFGSEAWGNVYQTPEMDPFAWQYGDLGSGTGTSGLDAETIKQIQMMKKLGLL